MKRPPGLWLLLSAGVLCLSLQNVFALRATELIFGKTSTTTTTTETVPGEPSKEGVSTEAAEDVENTTKTNLTGIPQIDYLSDPNLPRELNGYNLSSYPFYNSMPDDITFKCDGLHDGFYASVPHKCQVYHHCLFGTRYDFLCANYTAFDQKTFICHFVSEVDCNNSRKYWHRNDALYQAATTTTLKPATIVISPALTASPRRQSPLRPRRPSRRRPQYDYYDEEYEDEAAREDYYEEPPPRRRRKRPRPRPRPVYDDDYEDFEDDRYERRGSGRRNNDGDGRRRDHGDGDRKQHDRREFEDDRTPQEEDRKSHDDRRNGSSNGKPRDQDDDGKLYDGRRDGNDDRKSQHRDYDRREPDDHRSGNNERKQQDRDYNRRESDDRRNGSDRKPNDRREPEDRDRKPYDRRTDYDDRRYDDRKRYKDDRRRDYDDRSRYDKDDDDYRYDRDRRKEDDRKRRPAYDEDDPDDHEDRRPAQDKRPSSERRFEKRRPADEDRLFDRPRKHHRRPYDDDGYEDEKDDRRGYDRPRKNQNREEPQPQDSKHQSETETKPLVKPNSSSSVFNQPRMAPRIRLPVPKNEQNKFAYKPTSEKPVTKKPEENEEYYEDYEEELPSKRSPPRTNRKPESNASDARPSHKPQNVEADNRRENRRPLGAASRPRAQMTRRPPFENVNNEYEDEKPKHSRASVARTRPNPETKEKSLVSTRNRSNLEEEFSDEDAERTSKHPSLGRDRAPTQTTPRYTTKEQKFKLRPETTTTTTSTTITTTTSSTTTTTTKEPPRERPEPIVRVVKRPFLPSRGGNPYSSRGLQPVGAKALDGFRNSPTSQQISEKVPDEQSDALQNEPKLLSEEENEPKETSTAEDDQPPSNYKSTDNNQDAEEVQNGRRYPSEPKTTSFLINEQPVENYRKRPHTTEEPTKELYDESLYKTSDITESVDKQPPFKPSPTLIKVPVRSKYSDPIGSEGDEDEFRPVSNRPLRPNSKPKVYQEMRTTERPNIPERNPLDINENEYDVTLNDALNPTIPNLPVRNFPSGFSAASDYTYSTFHRPRYDLTLNQATENRYQMRAPSQRVETVVQPYLNADGKNYVKTNAPQYSIPSDQIYQNQNFRSNPQITQAQTQAFYSVY